MEPLPLKWRIGIFITILIFVIVTAISIIAYSGFREDLFNTLDYRLKSDISAVRQQLYAEDAVDEIKNEIRAILLQDVPSNDGGYKIWFDSAKTYFLSSNISDSTSLQIDPQYPSHPKSGEDKTFNMVQNEKNYRVIWARYDDLKHNFKTDDALNVLIYTSSDYISHEIEEFLLVLIILGGLIIWFSIGFITWILRWGLKPVTHITNLMDNVSAKHLDHASITFPQVPKELSPFVRAWSQMLSRLSYAMKDQRRFTSDASHELRTPIATIKSTLQLARSKQRSPQYYESAIDQSLEDIERLNHLTDQLLQLSRLDNVEDAQDRKVIDAQQLISELCEQYSVIARQQGRSLEYKSCPAKILGHIQLVRQLFTNLIDNAIKYSPENSTISVVMKKNDTMLKITVHDQGGGISENDTHLIFERFYRLDKARTKSSGGTGIGLSIAKEIAQKHGGDICVTSNPTDGTDFIVTLPMEPAD